MRFPHIHQGVLRIPFVLTVLSLFLSLLPIPTIVPAILLVVALSVIFPLSGVGYITRGVLSVLLLASLNSIAALIAWGLKLSLDSTLLIICYNLILLGVLFSFSSSIAEMVEHHKKILWIELVGVILATLAIGILVRILAQGADAVDLTRIVTFTDDNTAHLTIVNHIDKYGSYLYGNRSLLENGTPSGYLAYPQGWHLNTALATQLFTTNSDISPQRLLLSYYIVSSAWVGALAYLFTVLTLLLARSIRFKVHLGAAVTAVMGVGVSFFVNTIYPLFTWGAHPQIASFVLLLALIAVASDALTNTVKLKSILASISIIYIVAIAFIYYFLLPTVLLFIALFLLFNFRAQMIKFWKNPSIVFFALLLLISLAPVAMYFKYIDVSQAEVFKASGGTLAFSNSLLFAVPFMAVLYSFQKKSRPLLWAGILLLCSTLFMAVIMLYQYQTLGSLQYYGFKASHSVILLSALILSVLFTEILSYLFSKKNTLLPFPIFISIAVLSTTVFAQTQRHPLFDIYVKDSPYGLNEDIASAIVSASQSPQATGTLALGSCQSYFDVRAINMIIALSGETTSHQTKIALAQYNSKQQLKVFDLIRDYQISAAPQPLTILSSDTTTVKMLKDYLGASAESINFIDVSHGDPDTKCPLRLS